MINLKDFSIEKITGISTDIIILILLAAVIVLIILMIIQLKNNKFLIRRYKSFMRGKKARNLEGILKEKIDEVSVIEEKENYNANLISDMLDQYKHTFQKMGYVKYDAFDDAGGKLSFTLSLLDGKNNGFVLNAVHSKEGCYVYLKDIISGNAVSLLSNEEKEAVNKAMHSLNSRK